MHLDLATILTLHPLSLAVGALCFLLVRSRSLHIRGLGKMSMGFLVLGGGSLLAGAGLEDVIDYRTWTFWSFVSGPVSYSLIYVGLINLIEERPAGRNWFAFVVPIVLTTWAFVSDFYLDNVERSAVFLSVMAMFALAAVWMVLRDKRGERLQTRWGLAGAFVCKAIIALTTIVVIARPDLMPVTPAATFLLLILCQFAIAMFVLILVQERSERRLIALTETDSLTGIHNRHWMMDRLPQQVQPGSAYVIIDIDHFKQVNDRYGHVAGDQVLTGVAQAMMRSLGETAIFARMGGEEFGLFLPDVGVARAIETVEQLRATVASLAISHDGEVIPVTLSAGVAVAPVAKTMTKLMGRADAALYAAKRGGRNRVVLAGANTHLTAPGATERFDQPASSL
ncbi:GGDEF domain-containing protein [Rhizobium wuzhouense]|uniref:diguanylate cyclase n=1 Tax=Rhizobium wuzhouense TaxID=1986026 RepID=A0ABX5NUI4_9HYPH|nr:GGDEF domain-containing protein [Rhizobium wuzhouense]PYB75566.1 GGDEF domain-containing protein [Rhizobium wuzhouense]